LDLALFINAQYHGFIGRMEIQPNDIPDLFYKEGIGRELKMALAMGLKAKGLPDPMDRGSREPSFFSHGPDGPMGSIFGLGLKSFANEEGYLFVRDRSRSPEA
jgi:hypothetical protein